MEFLEVPLFDDDIFKLLVRFGINLFFLLLIVAFAIYPSQSQREFAFTAVMLNMIVFFICFSMKKLELDLGLALGLFAVFGVLRYRTDAIRPKEMTYLFIVIGIGVINSLSNKKTSYAELALVNLLIFVSAVLKEAVVERGAPTTKKPPKFTVEYDRLEWLGENDREKLLADIRERTGMDVVKAEVKSIDLTQNKATLTIWTSPPEEEGDPTQ